MCYIVVTAAARKGKLPRLCPIYAPSMPRFNADLGRGCGLVSGPFLLAASAWGGESLPMRLRTAGEKHRGFSAALILIHTLPTYLPTSKGNHFVCNPKVSTHASLHQRASHNNWSPGSFCFN
jgi:hypothetical protein